MNRSANPRFCAATLSFETTREKKYAKVDVMGFSISTDPVCSRP